MHTVHIPGRVSCIYCIRERCVCTVQVFKLHEVSLQEKCVLVAQMKVAKCQLAGKFRFCLSSFPPMKASRKTFSSGMDKFFWKFDPYWFWPFIKTSLPSPLLHSARGLGWWQRLANLAWISCVHIKYCCHIGSAAYYSSKRNCMRVNISSVGDCNSISCSEAVQFFFKVWQKSHFKLFVLTQRCINVHFRPLAQDLSWIGN